MTDRAKTTIAYAIGAATIAGLSIWSGGSVREALALTVLAALLPVLVTGFEQLWPGDDNDDNRRD